MILTLKLAPQDTPYVAARVDDDRACGAFALQLAAGGRTDDPSNHPAAGQLEVVRQGEWLGFRSAAAGGRFLQVKQSFLHSHLASAAGQKRGEHFD